MFTLFNKSNSWGATPNEMHLVDAPKYIIFQIFLVLHNLIWDKSTREIMAEISEH